MTAMPMSLNHWSLHKGFDNYQLLVQIRPTDAYDGIILHRIGEQITDTLRGLAAGDGRVGSAPVRIMTVWFRSEWTFDEDAGVVRVTKVSVDDRVEADDVMIVATIPLVVAGGVS